MHRLTSTGTLLFVPYLLFLILQTSSVHGQWEINKNDTSITSQAATLRTSQAQIVHNPKANLFLLVYVQEKVASGVVQESSILGQMMDSNNNLVGDVIPIFAYSAKFTGLRSNPSAVYNEADDKFLVVFQYTEDFEFLFFMMHDIFGVFVAGNGSSHAKHFVVADSFESEQNPVAAVNLKQNLYIVVWETVSGFLPRKRETDAKGTPIFFIGSVIGLRTFTETKSVGGIAQIELTGLNCHTPSVYWQIKSNSYLLVFVGRADNKPVDRAGDLYAITVDSHGDNKPLTLNPAVQVAGVVEVNTNTGVATHANSFSPILIPSNPLSVVWQVNGKSGETYIAAVLIDKNGFPLDNLRGIGSTDFINRRPAVAYNPTPNQIIVVYEYGQKVDSNDNTVKPNIRGSLINVPDLSEYPIQPEINYRFQDNERYPFIGFDGQYTFVTGWMHGLDTVRPDNSTERSQPEEVPLRKKAHSITSEKSLSALPSKTFVPKIRVRSPELDGTPLMTSSEVHPTTVRQGQQQRKEEETDVFYHLHRQQRQSDTPPAFLVTNLMFLDKPASSNGDGDGSVAGEAIGIAFLVVSAIVLFSVLVVLAVVVYKRRDELRERMSGLGFRTPSLPRVGKKGFEEFTDEA